MAKTMEPMTSGTIWKRMILFALPLMLGNLFQQMYNTVDSLIVGRFIGSSALAAVSSSGSLISMLIGLLSGISSGAGVIVARHFGARDAKGLHRTEQHLDPDEFVTTLTIPFDEAEQMALDGRINDGKTIAAIFRLRALREAGRF